MKEDYPLYVKWVEATDWILATADKLPKSVRATLTHRIVNAALDVMEGIVEAIYTKDRSYILHRLNLYIEKLRVLFGISFRRRYISASQYEFAAQLFNDAGKMIGGWKKSG